MSFLMSGVEENTILESHSIWEAGQASVLELFTSHERKVLSNQIYL